MAIVPSATARKIRPATIRVGSGMALAAGPERERIARRSRRGRPAS